LATTFEIGMTASACVGNSTAEGRVVGDFTNRNKGSQTAFATGALQTQDGHTSTGQRHPWNPIVFVG
jgi:hypothetical protein